MGSLGCALVHPGDCLVSLQEQENRGVVVLRVVREQIGAIWPASSWGSDCLKPPISQRESQGAGPRRRYAEGRVSGEQVSLTLTG